MPRCPLSQRGASIVGSGESKTLAGTLPEHHPHTDPAGTCVGAHYGRLAGVCQGGGHGRRAPPGSAGVRRGPPGVSSLQVPHRAQHTPPDDAQRDIHPRAHITNTTQRTKKMMSIYNLHDRPSTTLQFPPSLPPPPPTLLPLCRAADFRTPSGTTPSTTRRRAGRAVPTTRRSPPRRTMAGPSTRSWVRCRLSAANSARLRNSLARPCKNFCTRPLTCTRLCPRSPLPPFFSTQ